MSSRPTVAVLGTGRMGAPIARNLLGAGFPVTVWNRTPERAAALAYRGAKLAASPVEAVRDAEVLITMVADGSALDDVMGGPRGALASLRPESIWIQMATIGLRWTDRFAARAAEQGIQYVDAPVSGSDGQARDRQLVVLASGPEDSGPAVDPIFDAIARETLWLGPAGQGTRLKLVLNNWLVSQVEAVAESIALAEALGLPPDLFTDTIAVSPLGSHYAVAKGREMIAGAFSPGFALRMAYKDVVLALDAAHGEGLDMPMTVALEHRWQRAMADGHAEEDVSSVIAVASPRGESGIAA